MVVVVVVEVVVVEEVVVDVVDGVDVVVDVELEVVVELGTGTGLDTLEGGLVGRIVVEVGVRRVRTLFSFLFKLELEAICWK